MLSAFKLTSLAIDGNMVDQALITALSSKSFSNLKELRIELCTYYRNIRLPFDETGGLATPLNWSGADIMILCRPGIKSGLD